MPSSNCAPLLCHSSSFMSWNLSSHAFFVGPLFLVMAFLHETKAQVSHGGWGHVETFFDVNQLQLVRVLISWSHAFFASLRTSVLLTSLDAPEEAAEVTLEHFDRLVQLILVSRNVRCPSYSRSCTFTLCGAIPCGF